MRKKVFLGIDGGGTYTRVAVVDMEGMILANRKWNGAASVYKDANARENVQRAICGTLEEIGYRPEDVAALCAGIAGYDSESDLEWVRELTAVEGMTSEQVLVNDAVIAHAGALPGGCGIIAIAGTGSIVFGINERQEMIRNFDFHHYAKTAARFLTYDFVYRVLAGEADTTDGEIIKQLFEAFRVKTPDELARLGRNGFEKDSEKRTKQFSEFAKKITEAVKNGSRLADSVCKDAAKELSRGIRLVGACFEKEEIQVALTGGVANSDPVERYIKCDLSMAQNKKYLFSETKLSPVLGAVLLAARQYGGIQYESLAENMMKQDRVRGVSL